MEGLENDFLTWLALSKAETETQLEITLEENSPGELEFFHHFAHGATNVPLKVNKFSFTILRFLEREHVEKGITYTIIMKSDAAPPKWIH